MKPKPDPQILINNLEVALDVAMIQCNALQEEVDKLKEENSILLAAQSNLPTYIAGIW